MNSPELRLSGSQSGSDNIITFSEVRPLKTLNNILRSIIYILGGGALLFITYLNLTGTAFMPLTDAELVSFETDNVLFYLVLMTVLACIISFGFFSFRNPHGFFPKSGVLLFFITGTVLYLGFGLYLIFRIPTDLRADAYAIYTAAEEIKNGNYSSLILDTATAEGTYASGYLAAYPHQIGITLILSLLLRFLPGLRYIFILNLILILLNNLLMLNISDALFHNDQTNFMTVLLSFILLPHFFLSIFCYGIIPGLTALLVSFLALIKFEETGNIFHAVCAVIFGAFAIVLRNNYMIGVIAETILLLLIFLRSFENDRKKVIGRIRYIAAAVLLIAAMIIPNTALKIGIGNISGHNVTDSIPRSAWMAMGLSEGTRAEGWYNGYNYNTFRENGYDQKATDEAARALIGERLQAFRSDHDYAYTFFMRKLASTWSEPTFQSVWVGPQEASAGKIGGFLFKNIYSGGGAYDITCVICSIVYLVVLAGCVLFLAKSLIRRIQMLTDRYSHRDTVTVFTAFPILFLLGVFLFHLVWETKSLYVFSSVYMLLPLAAAGLSFTEK